MSRIKDGALEMGTSVHEFQLLEQAAEYSNTALSAMTSGMNKLEAALQDAAREGGSSAKKFDDLGINWKKLLGMSIAERFVYISQSIDNLSTSSAEYSKWATIIGEKNMPKLREAAMNAAGGIDGLEESLKRTGEITDRQLEQYDKAINKLQQWKRSLIVTAVSMVDVEQGQRRVMEATALMNGKMSELYSKVPDIASRVKLLTDAWENYSGKKTPEMIAEYNKILAGLTVELDKSTEAQKKATAAKEAELITLGETKDSVAALSKKYGDSASYLQSLISLSNTALGKGADAARVIQNAISAATDAVTKDTAKMTDSLKTPYEKFLEMEKELQRRVDLKIPGADSLIKSFRETNPVIKETQTALKDFDTTLASVDAEAAYIIKLREINTQIKEWSANAAIGSQRAEELGAKMRQAAYEQANAKEMATAEDVKKFIRTPSQVREQDVADITNNQFLKSDEKDTAISEINTGFVTMRNNMIASAEELQNNTNLWGGLRDAAADATVQFNAATNVGQLQKVQASLDATREKYSALGQVGYAAVQSLSAGFARLIVEGGSVKDMLMGVVQMIAQMMIQYALMSAFKSMGFGGMFAGGGDVNPNKLYVVGEKGPELFSPKARGTIINQDQIASKTSGGSGAPVIQFNLSAYDTTGMSQMIDSKTPSIVAQALRQWKYENARGKM